MKKFLMGAAAFCCMMFSSVALTACGSDDKDDSGNNDPYAPKETILNVRCAESQDFLDVYNVTVTINGESETISSDSWSKSVKSNGLPAHYSINVKMSKKAGKDWDASKSYSYTLPAISYNIHLVKANGESGVIALKEASDFVMGGKFIDLAIEKFGEYSAEYDVDKYGKVTSNN